MLEKLIYWVENRPRFKEKVDLSKMKNIAASMKNPQNNFKSIHITGTNGKGSTAHFLHSILSKKYKVGLFTSPYIIKFNERLQINDVMIADEVLERYLSEMKSFIETYEKETGESFTFFEIMTLLAFQYFSDENVDYAIIEVGIGGTLDSTNIINPMLSIITSIGFDHENQLGNTLLSILDNKLGIVKENKALITGVEGFDDVIKNHCHNKNSKVFFLKDEMITVKQTFPLSFRFEHHTYEPTLQGLYQAKNASLAIMAANYLEPKLPITLIKQGIKDAFNPARFEMVSKKPIIILDGAHNEQAMNALIDSVKQIFPNHRIKVLFACMQDKPFDKMLNLIETITKDITLTTIDYHRALNIEGLSYKKIEDPKIAFNTLKSTLDDDVLLVTGSLYFVSYIRNIL